MLVAKPPTGPDWMHEVKHDGYRLLARKEGERVTLWTGHGTKFTDRLPRIAQSRLQPTLAANWSPTRPKKPQARDALSCRRLAPD
jgi:ATP-dependent DNA ligase